jgi:hypothetical protein
MKIYSLIKSIYFWKSIFMNTQNQNPQNVPEASENWKALGILYEDTHDYNLLL